MLSSGIRNAAPKPLRILLDVPSPVACATVPVQNQVAELVSGVHAPMFRRLPSVEEHEWRPGVPERVRIYLLRPLRQRKHANPLGLEQVNHVPDREHTDTPIRAQDARSILRLMVPQIGKVGRRQAKPSFDPLVQLDRQRSCRKRGIALTGCHRLERPKARAVRRELFQVGP